MKIGTAIRFPTKNLDLSSFVVDDRLPAEHSRYNLFAVSNHYGGMGGGHYTAHACNPVSGKWCVCCMPLASHALEHPRPHIDAAGTASTIRTCRGQIPLLRAVHLRTCYSIIAWCVLLESRGAHAFVFAVFLG